MKEWYFEARTVHTLDYPPMFAYFEWFLSQVLALIDPDIVDINKEAFSVATVRVHRLSVIVSDLLFVYACYRFMRKTKLTPSDGRLTKSEKIKIWFFINYCNFILKGQGIKKVFFWSLRGLLFGRNLILGTLYSAISLD